MHAPGLLASLGLSWCCLVVSYLPSYKLGRPTVRNSLKNAQQSISSGLQPSTTILSLSTSSLPDWSFVDDVFLITTTSPNNDRLELTKQQLQKCNLWDRVQVRQFQPDDGDRVRGCYTSHVEIMQEIQQRHKGKQDYRCIVVEDNLEVTQRCSTDVIDSVGEFVSSNGGWEVFHLAYMMYVPGLSLHKIGGSVVQMQATAQASVGTSAYIISKSGVDRFLANHAQHGYTEAVPNIMAELFPTTRYAAYPMPLHRAAKVGSLVNPQMNDFRKVMFNPVLYGVWERLMVSTGLQNNQLFPGVLASLLLTMVSVVVNAVSSPESGSLSEGSALPINPATLLLAVPLVVALWGATLFGTNAGFTKEAQEAIKRKQLQQQQQL